MAGSSNTELADLLNEMLSVQEKLRKHGFRLGRAFLVRLQASLRPLLPALMHRLGRLLREPVSAFHGRMGYSANMWLHHFESLRPEDQPPKIRDHAFWVRKFPLNESGAVALSDLVGDLESVQVLRFISGADPDPRPASASASSASPGLRRCPWMLPLMLFRSLYRRWFGAAGGFAWTARRPAAAKVTRIMTR